MLRLVYDKHGGPGRPTRREWLALGLAGCAWSAGLGSVRRAAAANGTPAQSPGFGKAKSVILVFANGGQSQLDTWDPKPAAPAEVRGAFDSIRTSVPGTLLCEHLPHLARLADRYTVVRSVSHDDLDHGSAAYLALTGRFHPQKSSNPPQWPRDLPTYGAVVKRVRPTDRFPHTAVHVNAPAVVPERLAPGQFGGILGRDFEPLTVGDVTDESVVLPGLAPQPELPPVRLQRRRSLLETLDRYREDLIETPAPRDLRVLYEQAYEMLAAPQSRRAFDLSAESTALRERYGRNRSGQACLLARRLVEAGVPWITVVWNHSNRGQDIRPGETDFCGWDTHNDIFDVMKQHLLPRFDQSFSALLEDLDQRGLLDETLVVCLGEFGRAPRVAIEPGFKGNRPGRKHWANVYSVVFAGAGVGRGGSYGASDRMAARPARDLVTPGDLAATMYAALGIDPAAHFRDPLDRPFPIATGRPIAGLYG